MDSEKLLLEQAVPNHLLPPGDWEPHVGWKWHEREQMWEVQWVSSVASPLPGVVTVTWKWVADPGEGIIVRSKEAFRVEKIKRGPLTVIRFWMKG
jgi:predicted anti-sigma-YlaC factor YlaD